MCTIISAYAEKKNTEELKMIFNLIASEKSKNPDGIGVVALNDKNYSLHRGLKINPQSLNKLLTENSFVNVHVRTATSGEVSDRNIHFWEKDGWYFAHNGMAYGAYYNGKVFEDKKCDSFHFFKELIEKKALKINGRINLKKLLQIKENANLWGRFICIYPEKQKVYYVGDYHTYLINDRVLVVSSTTLDFKHKKTFLGLEFENEKTESPDMLEGEIDGVWLFNIARKQFKMLNDGVRYEYEYKSSQKEFELDNDVPKDPQLGTGFQKAVSKIDGCIYGLTETYDRMECVCTNCIKWRNQLNGAVKTYYGS